MSHSIEEKCLRAESDTNSNYRGKKVENYNANTVQVQTLPSTNLRRRLVIGPLHITSTNTQYLI